MKIFYRNIVFKPIPNNTNYFVNRGGKIFSKIKGRIKFLSQYINSNGYLSVKANNKQLPVHRAVATTWLPNRKGYDVNHIDGDKLNNNVTNLEFITRRENLKHALRNNLHALKETPIIGTCIHTGDTLVFVCQADVKKYGFSQPNVNKCLKGERKLHKGYKWGYL